MKILETHGAEWERSQFVIADEFDVGGEKIMLREVFSDNTDNAFAQTICEGESGKQLTPAVTIRASRVGMTKN